jgi:hypothetical protein
VTDSMNETPFDEVAAEVMEFLDRVRAPNVPSQIATYIAQQYSAPMAKLWL